MNSHNEKYESDYAEWKSWGNVDFGQCGLGTLYRLNKIFKKPYLSAKFRTVLEIGYGNGEVFSYFKACGCQVYGTELNSTLIERALKLDWSVYQGDVWEIPQFDEMKFDVICAFDVLEHMSLTQLKSLFCWLRDHLSNDGVFIARFPEGASPFGLSNQNGDFTHISSITKSKIEYLCKGEDLEVKGYFDDTMSSNKLSKIKFIGNFALNFLNFYAYVVKKILKILLYPVASSVSLATNSVVVVSKRNINNEQ